MLGGTELSEENQKKKNIYIIIMIINLHICSGGKKNTVNKKKIKNKTHVYLIFHYMPVCTQSCNLEFVEKMEN